jgi:hypothetical protein
MLTPAQLEPDASAPHRSAPNALKKLLGVALPLLDRAKHVSAQLEVARHADDVRVEYLVMAQDIGVRVENRTKIIAARTRRVENDEARRRRLSVHSAPHRGPAAPSRSEN